MKIVGQDELLTEVGKIIQIFKSSQSLIRPHFFLTGESGSGKTLLIESLAAKFELSMIQVNAASLTKEGTSGNSLSKALSPLLQLNNKPVIVFVDEFDKLFISGNSNDSLAHETTTGVQNEFLKVLEAPVSSVYGDYGKYINASTKNTLFVFAGAFNGEANISLDRLRELGIKTEFLGRVGLVYHTNRLSLDNLYAIVDNAPLLTQYCNLFDGVDKEKVVLAIKAYLRDNYENNTLGARIINTLIHQYFIKGKLDKKEVQEITFQEKLKL